MQRDMRMPLSLLIMLIVALCLGFSLIAAEILCRTTFSPSYSRNKSKQADGEPTQPND